jgi:hypothetical protein
MKRLFVTAAALTIAIAAIPGFVAESQAASSKTRASMAAADWGPGSSYCKMAKSQRNAPSWNEYYGCLKTPARRAHARAQTQQAFAPAPAMGPTRVALGPDWGPGSPYCKMAKSQRNAPSWNEYYGCLRH